MNQRRNRRGRRGASLIELMLIVGSTTMILSLCGVFLHLVMRIDRSGRAALADGHTAAGFARQFRRDVHAARSAKASDGPAGAVDLAAADGPTVRYEATRFGVERRETSGESVVRRELYRLDNLDGADFRVDGPTVVASIRRVPDVKSISPRPEYRVEARLGRDDNWADARGAGR